MQYTPGVDYEYPATPMLGYTFVAALIIGVFVYEGASFWWRQNAWRRRWKDRADED